MDKTEKIIDMYNKGISYTQIQKELKIGYNKLVRILKENNLSTKRNKLSWDLQKGIDLFKQGYSTAYIGRLFGVSDAAISWQLKKQGYDTKNPTRIPKFNEHIFDIINTEEKAYWLGFIFADGYISQCSRKEGGVRYDFELTLAIKDKDHLTKFNTFMEYQGNNVKCDNYRCRWSVCNKHLWNILNSYGCTPRKNLTLKFPKNIPDNLIPAFIRGMFDGDGSISTRETSKTTLATSLVGTKDVIEKVKFYCKIQFKLVNPKGYNINTWVMSLSVNKSKEFLKYIYNNANIYLNRKYNLWKNYCRSLEESNE